MKCHYCGGKMAKGKTTYSINKKGYHLLVDDIPAWICSQCKEIYFEGDAVDIIQNVIKNIDVGVAKLKEEITA
ncbi:MAG: YgiT-type zinc finger protein [Euryarchaeota archaeon]|nr:YgiT-type zinc finger protein [Euryarchaeota archaeon]